MGKYVVVTWPESQDLMNKPGFRENSYLVNDDKGIEDFGSSAYFVDEDWLAQAPEETTDADKQSTCEQAYFSVKDALEEDDIAEFDNPFTICDDETAEKFYVAVGNEDIRIVTDKKNAYFYSELSLDDRYAIAQVILDGEFTV
jgi:hypothetical protein